MCTTIERPTGHETLFPQSCPVLLAPMAGITDLPFRRLVRRFGAGLVVSEMVACREMVTAARKARARAELGLGDTGTAVQLAGRDPEWMAEAVRLVEANGARIIDINMGCPAKKVTGGLSGSALLRDLPLAVRLIRAVVGAVRVPVTLKTRLGWDADRTAPELARLAEAEGVRMITVHGRTRCQFYKGRADWAAIRAVKDAVSIPVVANGDITDGVSAREAIRASGADAVMVGRGAQGAPWRPAEIAANLTGARPPSPPRGAALGELAIEHFEAALAFHGTALGARTARKHLGWYMDGAAIAPALRRRVLTAEPKDVPRLLREAFADISAAAA